MVKVEASRPQHAVKREITKHSGTKLETPVKGESSLGLYCRLKREKSERVKSEGVVKAERAVKPEAIKAERGVKTEGVKREAAVKSEVDSKIQAYLQRGMALRQQADKLKQVKKEQGGKRKKGVAKRKTTAKGRKARKEVMNREIPLTPQLASVVGADALSRPEAIRRIWAHCKSEGMLNPEDKREILFNPALTEMFGRPTARMTDLMGVLNPHFDYANASKSEGGSAAVKFQQRVKQQMKAQLGAKAELVKKQLKTDGSCKLEAKLEAKIEAKIEAKREIKHEAKKEPRAGHGDVMLLTSTEVKREGGALPRPLAAPSASAVARQLALHVGRMSPGSALVDCWLPSGPGAIAGLRFELVARQRGPPVKGQEAAPETCTAACAVEYREDAAGKLRPRCEAEVAGLDPGAAYHLCVAAHPLAGGAADAAASESPEVLLPQRARPADWSPQDALAWVGTQNIPELARKVQEYAVDGRTLLALGEEDLRALGLAAPFLIRRFLAATQQLKSVAEGKSPG